MPPARPRWTLVVLALLALAGGRVTAQEPRRPPADGEVVAEAPYELPAFAALSPALQKDVRRHATPEQYEVARADRRFALSKLRYGSDGLQVVAYLYRPASPAPGRLPAVVYCRGSWVAGDQAPALAPVFNRLAAAGFVVVAPQYRGSDGGEGKDDMGGADVADVINAIALARALPYVDAEEVFLYGESRGGMMTYQALRDGAQVRAAATVGAFTDMEAMLAADERSRAAAGQIWPDFAARRAELAERRSALRWVEKMAPAPLLILHGGEDGSLSPRQSLDLALRLEELGRPYEVHVFAGEGHVLSGRAEARDRQIAEWFLRHRTGAEPSAAALP